MQHGIGDGWSGAAALGALLLGSFLFGCGGEPGAEETPPTAQSSEPAPPAAVPSAPVLGFERLIEPLGAVYDAVEYKVRFPFVNRGDAELVIGEVQVTCGCTTTQLDRRNFGPGEGSEIEIVYKPAGRGPVRRTVHVHSNDPQHPVLDLHIDSEVRPFVEFEPHQLLLGELDRGREHRAQARFRCGDPGAVVLEIESLSPQLEVHQLGEDEEGWRRLELRIQPDVPWGSFIGRVNVRVRGVVVPGAEPVPYIGRLLVQAMMFDQLRIEPLFLSVGRAQPGVPFRAQTEIWHRQGQAFTLPSLRFEDPVPADLSARTEPLVGERRGYRVVIEGSSQIPDSPITGTLVIESDVEGEPQLRLSVLGRVGPAAGAQAH